MLIASTSGAVRFSVAPRIRKEYKGELTAERFCKLQTPSHNVVPGGPTLLARWPFVLKPAGFQNAQGILSAGYTKDATDPTWKNDPGFKQWSAFMDEYYPSGDKTDSITVTSYTVAQTLIQVLKQCGNDLTREKAPRTFSILNGSHRTQPRTFTM